MTMLELALECAARGWYVFPLHGKFPAIPKREGGQGFKDATLDADKIREWWTRWPSANVGIACGASGLLVFDADHGLTDESGWRQWCSRNGLPMTYTVRSGRRPEFGAQMYYKGGAKTGTFSLDGVTGDIKSVGGYVLAAGCIHPDTKETYTAIDPTAEFSSAPSIIETSRVKRSAVNYEDDGELITENRNNALTHMLGKARRLFRLDRDGLEELGTRLNATRFAVPLPEDEVKQVAGNVANYPLEVEIEPPTITIGGKKAAVAAAVEVTATDDVEVVEELDPSLKATPLPDYPLPVFEGTLYMEFARRAQENNFVPLEFFIEGAMTYAGAIAGDRLRGMAKMITPRLYTVLLALAGLGKGTTFQRIREFAPRGRALKDVKEGVMPPACSVLVDHAGSENGLNDALLKHSRVIEEFEELDRMFEKTEIKGAGKALMSIIRTCFDDTEPGITTTAGRPVAADLAYLSLLGAMTPSLWRQAMEGRDSYGSGLGGRFNLVASNNTGTMFMLEDQDLGHLPEIMEKKFAALDAEMLTIPTEQAAKNVLRDWWNDNSEGKAHYNRINVIAHRKALHLAWIRGLPIITEEIMLHALQLADYLVGVREAFSVSKGEDQTAINENRVMHILRRIAPKAVRTSQIVTLMDGLMSRAAVFRALETLAGSGEVDKIVRKDASAKKPYAVYRLSPQ